MDFLGVGSVDDNSKTGRRGEFLAAYVLESNGVECHHVDRNGSDLWCRVNDKVYTIEVKSSSRAARSTKGLRSSHYQFHTRVHTADFYCFVALDRQLLLLRPASQITAKCLRILAEEFNPSNQSMTIAELINL